MALVWEDDGSRGSLIGHLARASAAWKLFAGPAQSSLGTAAISPTWYTPGVKVPTWNYVTVHAYGRPRSSRRRRPC
jgi:transcriptional regulator